MSGLRVGVCGAGPGGLAAAIALRQSGHEVTVYEQAPEFGRVGADVNLTPNAVHALDGLGVGDYLRDVSARPTFRISRTWDTGEETSRLPMGDTAEQNYGAPQLTIHRADLLAALLDQLPADVVEFGRRATGADTSGERPVIDFADADSVDVDVVIAADGIHSAVRESQFGPDAPQYTGLVSWRSVIDAASVDVDNLDAFTKWWGPTTDQQVVVFPLSHGRETFIFATTRDDDWSDESWTAPGDVGELIDAHQGWHSDVLTLLEACGSTLKSALHIREPMEQWSKGAVTLLGDAAHPMVPFMAQGACMAIEDAVVLSRTLDGVGAGADVPEALGVYEATRIERTARIQRESSNNEWMKGQGNADWLYGYDAWNTPLVT